MVADHGRGHGRGLPRSILSGILQSHPESTHCQESFHNPPVLHAAAVPGLRRSPEQQF